MKLLKRINQKLSNRKAYREASLIFDKFKDFTMVPRGVYLENILLSRRVKLLQGAIVECGVWRGGMIAGMASVLGNKRSYYLYDSYEGLPQAGELDGQRAKDYQQNTTSETYLDNCKAEITFAQRAMKMAGIENAHFVKGWFSNTVQHHNSVVKIALLRLDGDWYNSTMDCLVGLFQYVVEGGLIIIDDYQMWDGCTRAVHDFLSQNKLPARIREYNNSLTYIEKTTA